MTRWYEKDGVRNRVIELLKKSGTPLEIYVSSLLKTLENSLMKTIDETYGGLFIDVNNRYVYNYSGNSENVREIDHYIELYNIFKVNDVTFNLRIVVAIECKHREGVKLIGFPTVDEFTKIHLPIVGDIFKSPLFSIAHTLNDVLCDIKLVHPVAIEFKSDGAPLKVFDESLIYKAGTALYDFASSVFSSKFSELFKSTALSFDEQEYSGMNSVFAEDEGTYKSFSFFDKSDILKVYSKVAKKYRPQIVVFIPVICIDSDLTIAELNSDSTDVKEFSNVDFMASEISFSKWSVNLKTLMDSSINSPHVIIVNKDGARRLIEAVPDWSKKIYEAIFALVSNKFEDVIENYGRQILE